MQITRSATTISWIPSDSIPGLLGLPMEKGLMHYDPPPPRTVTDLEPLRRRGEFRFANVLRAWIDVERGVIGDCGYAGAVIMGLTPFTVGSLRGAPADQSQPGDPARPQISEGSVTFRQTAGGRPGFSFLKPSARWPGASLFGGTCPPVFPPEPPGLNSRGAATGRYGLAACAWSLAQVSLRPRVRLKTSRPGVESGSGQK